MNPRILIAGVGNIFLGDDAFGVEAANVLAQCTLPAGVQVVDFGIRGFDLAYALLDPWDAVILVDALPRATAPGTLSTLEIDLNDFSPAQVSQVAIDAHSMDPVRVLALASSLGRINAKVYIVGCEPADFGDELEGRMGLSPIVQSSLTAATEMVLQLVHDILAAKAACAV